MYVVIAEASSDIDCLKILIRNLANNKSIPIEGKGFGSCGDMLNKGAKLLSFYGKQKECHKFIICYDRDKDSAQQRYEQVISKIIKPAEIKKSGNLICILIPTEEIEAWILADIKAVSKVFSSFQPKKEFLHPETITNPKETLESLINKDKQRPLYTDTSDNKQIMEYLDLEIVKKKCPSFAELANFVENDMANYPIRKSK
jgi:hypothetical protein